MVPLTRWKIVVHFCLYATLAFLHYLENPRGVAIVTGLIAVAWLLELIQRRRK